MIISYIARRACPRCGEPVALSRAGHTAVLDGIAWAHWVPCVVCDDFRSYPLSDEDLARPEEITVRVSQ